VWRRASLVARQRYGIARLTRRGPQGVELEGCREKQKLPTLSKVPSQVVNTKRRLCNQREERETMEEYNINNLRRPPYLNIALTLSLTLPQ